jgi:hypothetical protein
VHPSRVVDTPLCIIRVWDAELAAAGTKRNAARGVRTVALSQLKNRRGLPCNSIPFWAPRWSVCDEHGETACMHARSTSSEPIAVCVLPGVVAATLNNVMTSLTHWLFSGSRPKVPQPDLAHFEGQTGCIPYVLERAETVREPHAAWLHAKERIPALPLTQRDRHGVALVAKGRQDGISFETDSPHTDTTFPYSETSVETRCVGLDNGVVCKIPRGSAIKMLGLVRV